MGEVYYGELEGGTTSGFKEDVYLGGCGGCLRYEPHKRKGTKDL